MTADRIAAEAAYTVADQIVKMLQHHAVWIGIAGSLRRGSTDVKDIEIVAVVESLTDNHPVAQVTDRLVADGVIQRGSKWGIRYRSFSFDGYPVDLFVADRDNAGYILWLRTGPRKANRYVATQVKRDAPFTLRDGYVWAGNRLVAVPNERTFFSLLGLPHIAPYQRTEAFYRNQVFKWSDPSAWVKPLPAQQVLFEDWEDMVVHRIEARPKDSGVSGDKEGNVYQWSPPFLADNGRVWAHVGYGDWKPLDQDHKMAQAWQVEYTRNDHKRRVDAARLRVWLSKKRIADEQRIKNHNH